MFEEKRRFSRVSLIVATTLTLKERVVRASECRNISHGGMYVVVQEPVGLGETGRVVLTKKCGKVFVDFAAEFQVVWEDTSNMAIGLQFTHIDESNLKALEFLLSWQ